MLASQPKPDRAWLAGLWLAYRLRWKRRRLLFRIWRKRHQLISVTDRTSAIEGGNILAFCAVRNESVRLPYFLDYYRALGVDHFLFVDNDSDDGTRALLEQQPDVSLWSTSHSYRLSRFGMDWLGWLQLRYGHGHWCLTVDADELLTYPFCDDRKLPELTAHLDRNGTPSFGALMLDMYPKGRLLDQPYMSGDNPITTLNWFDHDNHTSRWHPTYDNLWIQGGARARVYFETEPQRAPTMNKVPLVKWNRRFAYVTSTHQLLPRRLHDVFGTADAPKLSGALLHTKFLNIIGDKSKEELSRRQHFENSALYTSYHQALTQNPDLWHTDAQQFEGWKQLVNLELMSKGDWV